MGARITIDSDDLVRAEELVTPEMMIVRFINGTYDVDEESGELLKRCSACREYWSADSEFFFPGRNYDDGLHCMCKACYLERLYAKRRAA